MEDHVSGQTLKDIRVAEEVSLGRLAEAMAPPVSRQYLAKVEAKQSVPSYWVGKYIAGIRWLATQADERAVARLVAGSSTRDLMDGRYDALGSMRTYDDGYQAAARWRKKNPEVRRVTLVVTAWPQTQGVIDALNQGDITVVVVDGDSENPVLRRVL